MMDIGNNWTQKAKSSWLQAFSEAERLKHSVVNYCHLFSALWKNTNKSFIMFLSSRGLEITSEFIDEVIKKYSLSNKDLFHGNADASIENNCKKCSKEALKIASKNKHSYVGVEHFIYGILKAEEKFCDYLCSKGVDTEHLKLMIEVFIAGDDELEMSEFFGIDFNEDDEGGDFIGSAIEKFCTLLNEEVLRPSFATISGREKEISLMEEILCRKMKSNCILVGEAGTGKTTIAEGLAQLIENENYKGPLAKSKIYSLDVSSMIAGTRFRGQFEERFKKIIDELRAEPSSILFIDEIHTIIGAGSKEGTQDLANMLKPALARGEIKCIGATTSSEYKKYFEKDAALARRFHPVYVDEPKAQSVVEMLNSSISSYESHHKVSFPKKLIGKSVDLCEVYLPHQRFPDKAFDVIDQACSKARIRTTSGKAKVCDDDIYQVIADKINVDVQTIKKDSVKTFANFEKSMNSIVFGQKENMQKIYEVLACAKTGMRSDDKPIASFFFVGPTSVGKTHAAKQIAKEFYGNDKSFLQLNMSEYQEQTSISRLIGASAGYVGFEEGGLLTEFVRKNPNSLILFDEAEKCNPNVLNLLLQILDEAQLKDNLNRSVDFSRCIVVMTSNIGVSESSKPQLGFMPQQINMEDSYKSSVKTSLPPELVSRIDEIVVFNPLTEESISKIFESRLKELAEKMKKNNVEIKFQLEASDFIDFKSKEHAREIKKIIRSSIEIPLAKFLIQNPKTTELCAKMLDGKLNIC